MVSADIVQAAHAERTRKARRYFGPHNLSPQACTECRLRLPLFVVEEGHNTHAMCEHQARQRGVRP